MLRPSGGPKRRLFPELRAVVLIAVLVALVTGGWFLGVGSPTAPPRASPVGTAVTLSSTGGPPLQVPFAGPSSGTASFFSNNSTFATPLGPNEFCQRSGGGSFVSNTCDPQAQNPSVLTLANGDLAVGYSDYTRHTSNTCSAAAGNTSSRVGFSISADGGRTFAAAHDLGNDTCSYLQATEPSFAVSSSGTVYGAFVEYNDSSSTNLVLPPAYVTRAHDGLGFVRSTDNGTTWSTPTTLYGRDNVSRPAVAAFGQTVYVLFLNISNGTATYPGGQGGPNLPAISVNLLYSADQGITWHGPYRLPGMNASAGYNTMAASIAVNATGTVAVAYATNRTCLPVQCGFPSSATYIDDIYVVASRTNGSTWGGMRLVQPAMGESHCWSYANACYTSLFQWTPQTAITFDASGKRLLVAWDGLYDKLAPIPSQNYHRTAIFFAVSSNLGASWTNTTVAAQTDGNNNDYFYAPSVAAANGVTYVSYTIENQTGCGGASCPYLDTSYSQWVRNSSNYGTTWAPPVLLTVSKLPSYTLVAPSWPGFTSSIGFSAGSVRIAYSVSEQPVTSVVTVGSTTYTNTTNPAQLELAAPYSGAVVPVNVTETGLSAGSPWSFAVDGQLFNTTSATFTVTNVPVNQVVVFEAYAAQAGYRTESAGGIVGSEARSFATTGTVTVHYELAFGIQLFWEPANAPPALCYAVGSLNLVYNGSTYFSNPCTATPSFPWFFPNGSVLSLAPTTFVGGVGVMYWSGTGPGSFTGLATQINLTVAGVDNETLWGEVAGAFNVSFTALGVPGTSTVTLTFNGTNYSGPASSPIVAANILSGPHAVSNAHATSATAGYEYFGGVPGGTPVDVPVQLSVNLTFAYVDVGSAAGVVPFHAMGVANGSTWHLTFNGTTYSSSTPWINITTHSGTFPWHVGAAVSQNGSVGYTPSSVGATVTVTVGTAVSVAYVPAYRLQVLAGQGGQTTATGIQWVSQGSAHSVTATALSGYTFAGWTGFGLGSVTGANATINFNVNGPVLEVAAFYPLPADRFNATFVASGLPSGTWWGVTLNGRNYSSNGPTLTVGDLLSCAAGAAGQYAVTVPFAYVNASAGTRYVAGPVPTPFCITQTYSQAVVFTPEYLVTVAGSPGGSVLQTTANFTTTQPLWVPAGQAVQVQASVATGYQFLGWNGTGNGSANATTASVTFYPGGPVYEFAAFAKSPPPYVPSYTVSFYTSVAFEHGTAWNLTLGGQTYSSTTVWINVTGLSKKAYPLSVGIAVAPDGLTRYRPTGVVSPYPVTGNGTQAVAFGTEFWVAVQGSSGGAVGPASGWSASGASVTLTATAGPGETFVGWTGTGTGSYTGSDPGGVITVNGPITEVAQFTASPPGTSTASGFFSNTGLWIGVAVAGAVVGLVVGLLAARGRGPKPAFEPEPAPAVEESTYGSEPPPVPSTDDQGGPQ